LTKEGWSTTWQVMIEGPGTFRWHSDEAASEKKKWSLCTKLFYRWVSGDRYRAGYDHITSASAAAMIGGARGVPALCYVTRRSTGLPNAEDV